MEGTVTEKRLRQETEKWTSKIAKKLENTEAVGSKGDGSLANIKAYVSDSRHFLEKGDLVRSFNQMSAELLKQHKLLDDRNQRIRIAQEQAADRLDSFVKNQLSRRSDQTVDLPKNAGRLDCRSVSNMEERVTRR